MTERNLEVLSARVEGIGEAFLVLGALLNRQGVLDGQNLQAHIRRRAEALEQPHPVVLEQMEYLADQLLRNFFHGKGLDRAEIDARLQEVVAERNPSPD